MCKSNSSRARLAPPSRWTDAPSDEIDSVKDLIFRRAKPWLLSGLLLFLAAAGAGFGQEEAQEEAPDAWSGQVNLSAVVTSGNAEAETFGLRAKFNRVWEWAALEIEMAGLRAESTTTERFGVGTPGDFRPIEESTTELTAENYLLR